MKNKKFALTLALEENEELMFEIDKLIRERAKAVLREESEKIFGESTIQKEVRRLASNAFERMKSTDWMNVVRNAFARDIDLRRQINESVVEIVENQLEKNFKTQFEEQLNGYTRAYINSKLDSVVQRNVIEAVVRAVTKE